jgi:hypothetical protein
VYFVQLSVSLWIFVRRFIGVAIVGTYLGTQHYYQPVGPAAQHLALQRNRAAHPGLHPELREQRASPGQTRQQAYAALRR